MCNMKKMMNNVACNSCGAQRRRRKKKEEGRR
jgi:hypothetical protein